MSGETTITIIGNLTGDPELNYTQSGLAVASFTIASSPRVYNKQVEQWQDGEPLFMRCSAWRDLGDHVTESLTKGTRVIASGRLRQRTYETSDGDRRTVVEMTVDEIGPSLRFATAKPQKAARSAHNGHGGAPADPWASSTPASDEPPF
ncbi:single-stranded DNA-binding protein [Nonomuraea lactucae]|uniref:single-stranded DNA-binding protein n=1 Tax=Nonomuraea lactucae TaxID=2249762 RepID=UPI000DE557C5|nr:single-stranded DNA-binding protein [Nonomuraea lactucae]